MPAWYLDMKETPGFFRIGLVKHPANRFVSPSGILPFYCHNHRFFPIHPAFDSGEDFQFDRSHELVEMAKMRLGEAPVVGSCVYLLKFSNNAPKIELDRNLLFLQIIPMHIASIIIGFAIGTCVSGIIVFALFQRRKNEGASDNKIMEDKILNKNVSDNRDNTPLLLTLDEMGKIFFGEDEEGQVFETADDEFDDLLTSQSIHK